MWTTRIGQMVDHFPGAMVTGHHFLIKSMTNHPQDRHVLAAAVRGRADLIVTQNTTRAREIDLAGLPTHGLFLQRQHNDAHGKKQAGC